MNDMTVEILLASYNGAQYIREQIDSILAQSDDRWHLTLSDDGSTDETPRILDEYAARYPEKIARVHSGRKFGSARDHFYYLINTCKAAYMLTCDQDDKWYPDKVKKTLDALTAAEEEHGEQTPILVFSDQTPTDAQLRPLAPSLMRYQNQYFESFDYRSLLMQNVVTGGAMGFNRALAQLAGRCTDPSQTIMHDWWMAVVAARFGKVIYLDEPLGDYRQHGGNCVGAKDVRSIEYALRMLGQAPGIRDKVLQKKAQAQVFLLSFENRMTADDVSFLVRFSKRRSGLSFYVQHREVLHGLHRKLGMIVFG